MKRIEAYKKEIVTVANDYLKRGNGPSIMQLYGRSGMGKTLLARQCVKDHGGLYFSFRNLDAAFAPRIFIPGCNSWQDFFVEIQNAKIAMSSFSMTWTIEMTRIYFWRCCNS